MTATRWLALESNPESMCKWAASLGLDIKQYSFNDVYGFDEISLSWVNKPCKAVLMLFPITFAYEQLRKKEDERILNEGVKGVEDIIFFKQRIANACGTIALLHALANAGIKLEPGILTELFTRCKGKVWSSLFVLFMYTRALADFPLRVHCVLSVANRTSRLVGNLGRFK